jgi:Flp pilus assembly protein TadD
MYPACNGLGVACKRTGRSAAAIVYFRQALAIKPDFHLALINLGITLLETGRAGEALDCFLTYREKFYSRISASEQQRVDRLIAETRNRLGPAR